jgi:hypothetical protein
MMGMESEGRKSHLRRRERPNAVFVTSSVPVNRNSLDGRDTSADDTHTKKRETFLSFLRMDGRVILHLKNLQRTTKELLELDASTK